MHGKKNAHVWINNHICLKTKAKRVYSPSCKPLILLVRGARFELTTLGFGGRYSIQLS